MYEKGVRLDIFHLKAKVPVPWVPDVFSRVRQGVSEFRRPRAEDKRTGNRA